MTGPDDQALIGAANRFRTFFRELEESFIERGDLLQQVALALLSREHVLMTGPPGTAKSKLAQAVLGRILCEETRQPSLFARQFTESTVQTDLVGPIDFKTLMDTGRTEHFTDEGILGAAHAFLDEVFDGRDMLLRSTLNLLHERELKQGTKISRGKVECAFMTTNRYLVEVLENERLVAFVDRIAFLNFVPKGFADGGALTRLLQRQVGGLGARPLQARLSIQDLDLLQAAADSVYVSESLCEATAALAHAVDAALTAARRADATFIPSRYISTRGIVRLTQLLRAICIADWIFSDRKRPFEARASDIAYLRFGLTLCGPDMKQAAALLERESDPRERRQLGLVRAEQEIFERCLNGLALPVTRPGPPAVDQQLLKASRATELRELDAGELMALARKLSTAPRHPGQSAVLQQRLGAVLDALVARTLEAGLGQDADPVGGAARLAELADELERAWSEHRPLGRWLRSQSLVALGQVAALGPSPFLAGASRAGAAAGDPEAIRTLSNAFLQWGERLFALRDSLVQGGGLPANTDASGDPWPRALELVNDRLQPDLAAAVDALAAQARQLSDDGSLPLRLDHLAPVLDVVRSMAARLDALGGRGQELFGRVIRRALPPLVQDSWTRFGRAPRTRLLAHLERDLALLADAGLLPLMSLTELAAAAVRGVVGAEIEARSAEPPGERLDLATYRELRKRMPGSSLCFALVELFAPHLGASRPGASGDPDQVLGQVAGLVRGFPSDVRARMVDEDLDYVQAPLAYLERWWDRLSAESTAAPAFALRHLQASEFFTLTHEEGALARFELEARLIALVIDGVDVAPFRDRLRKLAGESAALVSRLGSDQPAPS